MTASWSVVKNHINKLAPKVICAALVAIAAMFMSEHYGASTALSTTAVPPRGPHHERDTTFAVIGVTALSFCCAA